MFVAIKRHFVLMGILFSISAGAEVKERIKVEITSLTNTTGNGAMEVCGTAVDEKGIKPLLVTIRHDISFYTTLTDAKGNWCSVIKRWTFDGRVGISATFLQKPAEIADLETKEIFFKLSDIGVSASGRGSSSSESSACYDAKNDARSQLDRECRSRANGKMFRVSGISFNQCGCQKKSSSDFSCDVRAYATCSY